MNKKNLIYIGILAVLLLFYYVQKSHEPTEKRFMLIENLNLEEITEIELIQKKDSVRIVKNTDWEITEPDILPCDPSKIIQLFQDLKNIEVPSTPVSENPKVFDKLGVSDSTAIQVVLKDKNNNVKAHYLFGNTRNYQFNTVRKAEKNEVWQLTGNVSYKFRPNIDTWRQKYIDYAAKSDLKSFKVKYSSGEYKLTNEDSVWVYSDSKETFKIKKGNKQLMKILNGWTNNRSHNWLDNEFESVAKNFKDPVLTVTVEKRSDVISTIVFASKKDDEKSFWMMKDNNKKTLYGTGADLVNRFTKSSEHFKE
ncbi:MAG: hypothetical protein CSB55_04275 [Candidatus Cloacimonadota bacterium]|nr:MAG: hypothetical protein CSB55_04275 [Candidatus Cloacimonadota bacterium]